MFVKFTIYGLKNKKNYKYWIRIHPQTTTIDPPNELEFENFEPIQIDETPEKLCNRFEIALNCDVPI